MMRHILFLLIFGVIMGIITQPVRAQTPTTPQRADLPKQEFYKAKVVTIREDGLKEIGAKQNIYQKVDLVLLEGPEKNKTVSIEHGGMFTITEDQKVKKDDIVIVSTTTLDNQTRYTISDKYRLNNLMFILAAFFLLVIIMAGKKGLGSILGMLISLAVIVFFIIPQIMGGANPLIISLLGSIFIMVVTIYLAHGFSHKTTLAIASTFISLIITVFLSILFAKLSELSGMGSEDIYSLAQGFQGKINFQGLLLGGIIIGTLGVLDDVTTTQTTTIFTLSDANPEFNVKDLFTHGMTIGREHITSLVNTLVLAYAGASIGVFIYLLLGMKQGQPLWVMLNSEFLIEEIIRTIAGSTSLILAVPITTIMAAFFSKYSLHIR